MKTISDVVMSDIAGLTGLFVTGTDTGVGKTWVAATLTRLMVQRGLLVRSRNPVESWRASGEVGLLPQNAIALWGLLAVPNQKILSMEENVDNILIK
ncbi:AAA family ATPase [Acidithiobacillus ferrivorans]|uniref:Dethiobiotin synthase n=1 Tax=Acidithiobacillus ferrivorans TaxID=160808 RepID=A0A1B9BXJ3_9PROT|nr:hypothetical protein [Acidithiobacillus ferrivorans]OCB02431.1 hypothetical protein BBC27_13340 [Acidithiobacillus ferrivorans]